MLSDVDDGLFYLPLHPGLFTLSESFLFVDHIAERRNRYSVECYHKSMAAHCAPSMAAHCCTPVLEFSIFHFRPLCVCVCVVFGFLGSTVRWNKSPLPQTLRKEAWIRKKKPQTQNLCNVCTRSKNRSSQDNHNYHTVELTEDRTTAVVQLTPERLGVVGRKCNQIPHQPWVVSTRSR